jgi:hypothetical protein
MRERRIKQWGAQENLWPKFILKSAPLRATSSGPVYCTLGANRKPLITNSAVRFRSVGISTPLENFTTLADS